MTRDKEEQDIPKLLYNMFHRNTEEGQPMQDWYLEATNFRERRINMQRIPVTT